MARRVQASVSGAVEPAKQKYAPSCDEAQWRWISWGSTFAAISWLIVSFLFPIIPRTLAATTRPMVHLEQFLDS